MVRGGGGVSGAVVVDVVEGMGMGCVGVGERAFNLAKT